MPSEDVVDFLDVEILGDMEYFLDPIRIAASSHPTLVQVRQRCRSFLAEFLHALRSRNPTAVDQVLSHIEERPEFRLGFSKDGPAAAMSAVFSIRT